MTMQPVQLQLLTLQPLRTDGPDALDAEGINGITKITLREIEVAYDNVFHEVLIRKADDVFDCAAAAGGHYDPIPGTGTLTHAVFEIQFADSTQPRAVAIRPPDTLTLGPGCNSDLVERWLTKRCFRTAAPVPERSEDAQTLTGVTTASRSADATPYPISHLPSSTPIRGPL